MLAIIFMVFKFFFLNNKIANFIRCDMMNNSNNSNNIIYREPFSGLILMVTRFDRAAASFSTLL